MKICKRCLYPSSHPLNLIIDDEGICSGCRIHEEKDIINWDERTIKLKSILSDYKNKSGKNYDCIIPVGSKDSYFIVHIIKNVYKMNPLLVTYNKHFNTAVGIRNLANLKIKFNCDLMQLTVSPNTVKKITRSTIRRFGSIYWHCIAGQTVYPVQIASKLKIPLIIWGAHQGLDQVGMFSHYDEVEMSRKYRKEHDLMGYEAENLINSFDDISEFDIKPYVYPSNSEIEKIGIRGIYLNNYIRWDSKLQHEKMIKLYGYETAKQNRTYDYYNDIDCWNYNELHDYIKYLKCGYSKVLDHVCREIRLGHISRDMAINLVLHYSKKEPINLKLFIDWLGITKNSLNYLIDKHRSNKIWYRDADFNWQLKENESILGHLYKNNTYSKNISVESIFEITDRKISKDIEDGYVLIGKGLN